MTMDQVDIIADKLQNISEELNDLAMLILSDAIANGERERPAMGKRVSQARRAVEKAIQHLSATSTD